MRKILMQLMGKFVHIIHAGNNAQINTLAEFNGQTNE